MAFFFHPGNPNFKNAANKNDLFQVICLIVTYNKQLYVGIQGTIVQLLSTRGIY